MASSSPSTSTALSEDADEAHGAHTFKIITTKRTLLLCAPSEEEEIKWLGAVRALVARRSGAGVIPGETMKSTGSNANAETSPGSLGVGSSGTGLKGKTRRVSASGIGVTPEEGRQT